MSKVHTSAICKLSCLKWQKGIGGILVAIVIWEFMRWSHIVDSRDLPSFLSIIDAAFVNIINGSLSVALQNTMLSWMLGLVIATITGIFFGALLGVFPKLELATRPIIEFIRPIPSVALIPVALLILGVNLKMELTMIVFASVWPILFSTKVGVESVDSRFLETATMLGLSKSEKIYRIIIPNALPSIATGIRTASSIALIITITVEMLTGQPGIGSDIQHMRLSGSITGMWGDIFITGFLGYLINMMFMAAEKLFLPWSPENHAN